MSEVWDQQKLLRLLVDCISAKTTLDNILTVLRNGVDPNGSVHKGLRPIHYAAYMDAPLVIQALVERGAKVNVADDVGYTPLHIAAKHGHYDSAKALIHYNAVVDFIGDRDDDVNDAPDVCHALAELTMNPLNLALENNHPKVAELLLQNGAKASQAYFLGHEINLVPLENLECLEVLLRYGANPDSYSRAGITTLMKACKHGDVEAVKVLLQYGADVDITCDPKIDQKRAIYYAILGGKANVTKALLEGGADMTKPLEFKYPPLEYAITQDKVRHTRLLLQYGADPNEVNDDNNSPLQIACSTPNLGSQKESIKLLLEYGSDPRYSSSSYSYIGPCLTPLLEYLSYFRDFEAEIIQLLLTYGAEINMTPATKYFRIKDSNGALHRMRKFKNQMTLFHLLIQAAGAFSAAEIIGDKSGLTEEQKLILLEEVNVPRTLMHQMRLYIRRLLRCPIPDKIKTLPLPLYLQNYLLYLV